MKRIYRSETDKVLGGVCGGLAEVMHIDATIIRLLTVIICLFTGVLPVLIIYLVAWGIMPVKSQLGPQA